MKNKFDLKAYLNWLEIEYPKTHFLEELIELASSLKEDLAKLSPFAIQGRYPVKVPKSLTNG